MTSTTFYIGALVGTLALLAAIAWEDFMGSRR
jgi:hypothetical protein